MSWTPSSPHEPRDDTRDDTVYNVPLRRVSPPSRFPGFLLAAVIAALIAFAALGAIFFSDRADAPAASGSPPAASGPTGAGSPGASADPVATDELDASGPPGPGSTGGAPPVPVAIVEEVCAEPVPAAGGVRPALIEAFREYCREGVGAVLAEVAPEPSAIRELAWGYAAGTAPAAGVDLPSYVYLALEDQRRIRRYLVATGEAGGTPTISSAGRVPALPADIFFSLSDEES